MLNIIASNILVVRNKICLLAKKTRTEAVDKHASSTTFLLAYSPFKLAKFIEPDIEYLSAVAPKRL